MWQVVLFNVTNGLIIGAFYVLMALGLSLILNLSNVINFAHGNFLALGGYLAYMLSPTLGYWGALLVSPLLTALLGVAVERLMIRRIYNRDPVYSLLLTFGLAFVIQDACRYIWGPNGLPMGLPEMLAQPITPTLFFITWYRVFMVTIVIVTIVGLFSFLRHTGLACASARAFFHEVAGVDVVCYVRKSCYFQFLLLYAARRLHGRAQPVVISCYLNMGGPSVQCPNSITIALVSRLVALMRRHCHYMCRARSSPPDLIPAAT